jgi:hypothetical protein
MILCTSTRATKEAAIIANASPALNDGAPHWKGYGTLILKLKKQVSCCMF